MSDVKLTRKQAAIIGAYTGVLSGPFSDMHEYIEHLIGRPVFTHEMGNEKLSQQIREKAKADFLNITADDSSDALPIYPQPKLTPEQHKRFPGGRW